MYSQAFPLNHRAVTVWQAQVVPARTAVRVQRQHVLAVDRMDEKKAKLGELSKKVQSCQKCDLAKTRTNTVFGSGSASAKLVFVGEAPGYHEDQQGVPFVGKAGNLLDQLLKRIALTRKDVFIANVLKCRPPDNRDPLLEEINQCRSYLEQQISIIGPLAVITLGNFATKLLTGKQDGISRVHGIKQECPIYEKAFIYPVYHPAAALYTPGNMRALEQDFDRLSNLLSKKPQPQVDPSPTKDDSPVETSQGQADTEQLGLF